MEYFSRCRRCANLVIIVLILCCTAATTIRALQPSIRLGGIFHLETPISAEEKAFTFSIDKVNGNSNFTRLETDIRLVRQNDTFESTRTVCEQLKEGVAAVFGAPSREGALSIRNVCDSMEVPYIATQEDGNPTEESTINIYPNTKYISEAIRDLVLHYKWTKVTILYEDDDGLRRLKGVLHASRRSGLNLAIYRIPGVNVKGLLKEIKAGGANHIIVDCRREMLPLMLEQMMEVQMLRSYYHYLFTNMDLHLLNMTRYVGDKVNVSTLHLLDNRNIHIRTLMRDWRSLHPPIQQSDPPADPFYGKLTTQTALIYDAVHLVSKALANANVGSDWKVEQLSCYGRKSWEFGLTVYNYIKRTEIEGATGKVIFQNDSGERGPPFFFISELTESGFFQVGNWSKRDKRLVMQPKDPKTPDKNFYVNRTLVITSIIEPPFMMLRQSENGEVFTGNDRYEGYCIDLMKELADIIGFEYEIREVADDNYGSEVSGTKQWNGMVGELIKREADMAVAPLTISYAREQVIDFSKPYMYLGITILFRQPEPQNPGVFSFLNPLSFDVWLYVVLAFLIVSITLFLLARFSPYEWYNEHPCNPEFDNVENQFTLPNCLWFSFGGLMQQGSEVNPRAFSTRVLSGFWWFFSLILISSYTANLAAFLTVERMVSPIEGADDMVKQTTIEYGTRKGGSTYTFFQRSKIPTYQKMWEFMSARPSVFTQTYEEGRNRVLNNKNYAYLMESTMAEYLISKQCKNLTQVGGLLNSRGYGIGLPLGSALRDDITKVVLSLQEDDTLLELKNKWWKTDQCSQDEGGKEDANELGLRNIGGIFLVLISGLVCGMLAAVGEFIWKSRQNAEIDRKSLCAEMMSEMRFACRCHRNRRPSRPSVQLDHKFLQSSPYPAGLNGQPIPMAETVA